MHYALRSLMVSLMLTLAVGCFYGSDDRIEVLSADGQRQFLPRPPALESGIAHDRKYQGGSPGAVMPQLVSTYNFPAQPPLREPFPQQEAPKHEVEKDLKPGDSTAADVFTVTISDFVPQAIDIYRNFNAIGPNDLTPPDTQIGVGPNHVVIATNDDWAIYDRNGNQQFRVDIQTFVGTTDFMFDPRVVYDYWNGRWLILYLRGRGNPLGAQGSWWTLLVSDDADPNGNWWWYDFNARLDGGTDRNQWVDFPHLGFDYEAVYLAGNMYDVGSGFRYAKVRILQKSQIYNATSANWYDFWNLPATIAPAQGYRVAFSPRHHYWAHIPFAGGNYVRVYRIENPLAWHLGSGTPNLVLQADIGVGSFSPPPNAREPGRGRVLWTVDTRITDKSRLNYPYLYTSHHVGVSSGQAVGSKYYRLDVSNNTAPRDFILQYSSVYDAFFPTLEATRDEDMVMGLNASNGDVNSPYYVSFLMYEWREGEAFNGAGVGLRFGSGVSGEGRWGDYSASHLDPCDFKTVWLAGEHALPSSWMTSASEATVRKVRTNLTCENRTGRRGQTVELQATLTRADNNNPVAFKPIVFSVDGNFAGVAYTDPAGVARLSYTIPPSMPLGARPLVAEFSYCPSDLEFHWSRSQCTLTVQRALDTTPPVATLNRPANACVCNPVTISGTASDPETGVTWRLEYQRIGTTGWTTLATGSSPVNNATLGTFNAPAEDYYTIRLTVTNEDGLTTSDSMTLRTDHVYDTVQLRNPANNTIIGGTAFCLDGTATNSCSGSNYVVEVRPCAGGAWTAIANGTSVINDPLGTWNTTTLADGCYDVRLTGTNGCGHSSVVTNRVTIDNTPPSAVITQPTNCSYQCGVVQIRGTANDANLAGWALYYTGGNTNGWQLIAQGNANVVNGVLANWNTAGLRRCAYTLRLVVTDRANLNCNAGSHSREYFTTVIIGLAGDVNLDGTVDDADLLIVLFNFGTSCN